MAETTPDAPRAGVPFRLLRYTMISTLIAFAAVALVLFVLQRGEERFFAQAQQQQAAMFARAQAQLARQNEEAARASLLAVHEAGHVNLTRLVANQMWAADFAPFVERAQALANPCRADARADSPDAMRACQAELGGRIRALPGFAALDAKAYAAMRSTSVFKIKVFDLRGTTVYSSEHAQIGEDGAANLGWRRAVAGQPASELTHRSRFSAFERVVEDRDLISSYVPVFGTDGSTVIGVFEIYSDVTPMLAQLQAASQRFAALSSANEAEVKSAALANQSMVDASSNRFLTIVLGLLAALYAVLLLIVRNGQRIIDRQAHAQEMATRREQLWHREKMAALATMAANVSHEVGNPLAVIAGVAQDLPADGAEDQASPARLIMAQTDRIAAMMRQISDFSRAQGEVSEWVDVNAMVKSVCDFHGFDRRFANLPIEFMAAPQLAPLQLVPDHLNEVLMTVLQGFVEDGSPAEKTAGIRVMNTLGVDGSVCIRMDCKSVLLGGSGTPGARFSQARYEPLRRRVASMGGRLVVDAAGVAITLGGGSPPT